MQKSKSRIMEESNGKMEKSKSQKISDGQMEKSKKAKNRKM